MAEPLFYVDLSEEARDYRHTALEPGLPLLDRQGVNFMILHKWLGDYIAEPEWRNENVIAFYMTDEDRGRLEDVDCQPATRGELQKLFAPDLDLLRAKIKKIRPESSTEEMVLRIVRKQFAEQTNDLEKSDYDSYFFKCRAGKEDWRLRWCVGYQRADLEPLRARLWRIPDGDFLGVRPPAGGKARKRKRTGPLDVVTSPWFAIATLLLIALFLYANRPTLTVTPAEARVPLGSRIEYKIEDQRWFFFRDDVTQRAVAQSNDLRVVEFDPGGVARAKSVGRTGVSFLLGNRAVFATIDVGPPSPPDALTIEPASDVRVAIGSTAQLKAIGRYADGSTVDLTAAVDWLEAADQRLLMLSEANKGLIQGDSAGSTQVVARFPALRADGTQPEATTAVQVVVADFKSLAVTLEPATFAVGQSSRVNVRGIDAGGQEHSLVGSSLVKISIDPTTAAAVQSEYLVGRAEGAGSVRVSYANLETAQPFTVAGRMLAEDVFFVSPSEVSNSVVYELIPLNVTTGSDAPIEAVSDDDAVVGVFSTLDENAGYEVWLVAKQVGQTEVTVSQNTSKGPKSQRVKVAVTPGKIDSIGFSPPVYTLRVGQPETANLVGTTDDGRVIKVWPGALDWEKQPPIENVEVNKRTLVMRPIEPTQTPKDMQVRLGQTGLVANATIEVRGGALPTSVADLDVDAWSVHPPVPARGRYINAGGYLGDNAFVYDADRGGLVVGDINDPFAPLAAYQGRLVTEVNGVSLVGLSPDELTAYFRDHPVLPGDVLRYEGSDGTLGAALLGVDVGAVPDFKQIDVAARNVSENSFDAELRLYLRQPGDYRLVDAAGTTLSDWTPYPADATPLIVAQNIPRSAGDEYDLYVERRQDDRVRKFQVQFSLAAAARRAVVDPVRVQPVDTVIDAPNAPRVRERVRVRIPRGSDPAAIQQALEKAGVGSGTMAPGAPAPGTPAPGTPAPGTPAPGTPAPGTPAPGTPAPGSPAPGSPAPGSPAPGSPAPGQPAPGAPAPPSLADAKPAPAPAPGTPAPGTPAAPSPQPGEPQTDDGSPAVPAMAVANDPLAPNAASPVSATPSDALRGSAGTATRLTGGAAADKTPPARRAAASDEEKKSSFLDALKDFNRRRKD